MKYNDLAYKIFEKEANKIQTLTLKQTMKT